MIKLKIYRDRNKYLDQNFITFHPSRGRLGGRVTVCVWKVVRTVEMILVSRTVVVMGLALKMTR